MNPFYNRTFDVTPGNRVGSQRIEDEFTNIGVGFDGVATALAALPTALQQQAGTINYAVDVGAVNAVSVPAGVAVVAYIDGLTLRIKALATNTGAATLNINAIGARPLVRADGSALQAGDILAGQIIQVSYDLTNTRFQLNASGAAVSATAAAASAATATNQAALAGAQAGAAAGFANNSLQSAINAAVSEANAAIYAAALQGTSTTGVTIGTGAKAFTASTGKQWAPGQFLILVSAANNANFMHGQVTSYNGGSGALLMNVIDVGGTGTFADWGISVSGTQGPQGTFVSNVFQVRDVKASGASGGAMTTGVWNTRVLQTVAINNVGGASLAANQITLPAGTYECDIQVPHYVSVSANGHVARLQNITAGATTLLGTTQGSASNGGSVSVIQGKFTIAAPTVFEVQHFCEAAGTNFFGYGATIASTSNVFTDALFKKVV